MTAYFYGRSNVLSFVFFLLLMDRIVKQTILANGSKKTVPFLKSFVCNKIFGGLFNQFLNWNRSFKQKLKFLGLNCRTK